MKTGIACALACALLFIVPSIGAEVTEAFDRTAALSPGGSFAVSNVNGRVQITAWDRDEVRIHAVKSARSAEALREVEIEVVESGDSVTVSTHLPKGWNKGGSVSYEIQAPASARVKASTVNGRLEVAGVQGALDVKSVNGSVSVADAASTTQAETVNGSLTVRYAAAPAAGESELSSVNGSVKLLLPATVTGDFTAKTVNGSIRTDFPLEIKKARFGPTSSLDGAIGSGGARYAVKTVNGSIRILNGSNNNSAAAR